MDYHTTILSSQFVTHDVKRFVLQRPEGFTFEPGQGVELAIDSAGWRDKGRPFTPTSVPADGILEFTIKAYPQHNGVTRELHRLESGAPLLMSRPFGTINYRGPGLFIAGGAGITPFMAILRQLKREGKLVGNTLLFSNKSPQDIIYEQELRLLLGEAATFLCTQQADCRCAQGRIDLAYLEKAINDLSQHFYICGPPPFVEAISKQLESLGAKPDAVVFER